MLINAIWPSLCQAKANGAAQDSQKAQNMENVPLTEVPLLARKDCIFEVVGDTVFERPTVYYNICQVWVTRRLPYIHVPPFMSLCHKEVLNEHFLWSFSLRSLKQTNIGCFVQLNTFRQHPFPYSREIILFTRTGQKKYFSLSAFVAGGTAIIACWHAFRNVVVQAVTVKTWSRSVVTSFNS